MPQKHKGPPQESIDSILLALSRRDDIQPEMLTRYFERLDKEWTKGAREKVLNLLRSSDSSAHAAALLILTQLATDFDLDELEDFVADPTVSDTAKLSLSPLLKELDSEMADEGIVEYLNDPAGAMRQMQMRLLELVGQSEMGVESVLEDVTEMPLERRLAFISWLGSSNDPRAAHLLIPLLESQTSKIASAAIEALEQLGSIAMDQTIPALNYILAASSNRALKQHARASLGRLTMHASPGAEDAAMSEARQHVLPPYEARISFIDGSGSQLIMLAWKRPDGLLKGMNVLYQDQWGIKDCYGIDEIDAQHWEELVVNLDEQGFTGFVVPFAYARALVLEARALNKRTRRKLSVAYAVWRPLVESEQIREGHGDRSRAVPTMLEALQPDQATTELARRGDELYKASEFMSWLYEPVEDIDPYIRRYWGETTPLDMVQAKHARKGSARKGRQKEKRALLEELVGEAVKTLIDDKWRLLYAARLRRQAALFDFIGREEEVSLMRAVSAVLQPGSDIPIEEQAFPRIMMRLSIEQGPLRKMMESLATGKMGSLPVDPFSDG
jgi:HEAT repeats